MTSLTKQKGRMILAWLLAIVMVIGVMSGAIPGGVPAGRTARAAEEEDLDESLSSGLVIKEDWESDSAFTKEKDLNLKDNERELSIAIVSEEGDREDMEPLDPDLFTVRKDGETVTQRTYHISSPDWNPEGFILYFNEEGTYTLSYGEEEEDVITLHVSKAPLYVSETTGNALSCTYNYGELKEVGNEITIEAKDGYKIDEYQGFEWGEEGAELTELEDQYVSYDQKDDTHLVIKATEECEDGDSVKLAVKYVNQEDPDDSDSIFFDIEPAWAGPVINADEAEEASQDLFSGAYMPKEWFEDTTKMWSEGTGTMSFWTHGSTIQEVIDELDRQAKEKGREYNTGYVNIALSGGYGDEEISPQYISSSGNIKGILIGGSGSEPCYIKPNHVVEFTGSPHVCNASNLVEAFNENAFRPEKVEEFTAEQIARINAVVEAGGQISEPLDGKIYELQVTPVQSKINRDQVEIRQRNVYTIKSAEPVITLNKNQEAFLNSEYPGEIADMEIRNDLKMPGIHVNLYTDVKVFGDMGKLTVGYPDESLTGGKTKSVTVGTDLYDPEYFNTYSKQELSEIPSATGTLINSAGEEESYTYGISTYDISSESVTQGSVKGADIIVPEPNALFVDGTEGLSYEQLDAVENGDKLTVTMTADNVAEDAESAKEAVTAIQNEITSKNAAEKKATDRNTTGNEATDSDKISFMDLSVKAAVGDGDASNIKETKVPLTVTVPVPDDYDLDQPISIAGYHEGTVTVFEEVTSFTTEGVGGLNVGYILDKEGKSITFLTDKFSTYAIAGTIKKGSNEDPTGNPGTDGSAGTDRSGDSGNTANTDTSGNSANTDRSGNVDDSGSTTDSDHLKLGDVFTSGKGTYKITKESSDGTTAGEVAYQSPKKKSYSKVIIPANVEFKGVTYSVTSVAAKAFQNNKNLANVTLPATVKNIGKRAFYGCKKLKKLTVKTTVLKKIGKKAFAGVPKKAKAKVPGKKLRAYKKLFKRAAYKGKVKK